MNKQERDKIRQKHNGLMYHCEICMSFKPCDVTKVLDAFEELIKACYKVGVNSDNIM